MFLSLLWSLNSRIIRWQLGKEAMSSAGQQSHSSRAGCIVQYVLPLCQCTVCWHLAERNEITTQCSAGLSPNKTTGKRSRTQFRVFQNCDSFEFWLKTFSLLHRCLHSIWKLLLRLKQLKSLFSYLFYAMLKFDQYSFTQMTALCM